MPKIFSSSVRLDGLSQKTHCPVKMMKLELFGFRDEIIFAPTLGRPFKFWGGKNEYEVKLVRRIRRYLQCSLGGSDVGSESVLRRREVFIQGTGPNEVGPKAARSNIGVISG